MPNDLQGATESIDRLDEWIPEQMEPGTLFLLEEPTPQSDDPRNPFVAVLACPGCGSLGLITHYQFVGLESMICGADTCSAEYHLRGEDIVYRAPQ